MNSKAWSYIDVTKSVENRIHSFAESARTSPAAVDLYKELAYGAFLSWDLLTTGWQEEGDRERIESLANTSFKAKEEV